MAYDKGLAIRGNKAYMDEYNKVVKGETPAQRQKRASSAWDKETKSSKNVGAKVAEKVQAKGVIGTTYKK